MNYNKTYVTFCKGQKSQEVSLEEASLLLISTKFYKLWRVLKIGHEKRTHCIDGPAVYYNFGSGLSVEYYVFGVQVKYLEIEKQLSEWRKVLGGSHE